ncbi:META domain-containing protein [Marinobacter zhejiangensis]|uniref:Heat shock protein HslJ n=1 Tax=Marinobacter zhejiangensis TaxID=488535 RepID=A0A1I4P144_9GAMM|nr:META domain-containing protein [Marinobacter zhejiangensis]SFM21469.1 Heat shock protein HslJ [Marinobacter zhejiangensis]
MKSKKMTRLAGSLAITASILAGCSALETEDTTATQTPDQGLMQLHDIWVLETMNGEALELTSEAQRPRMEIDHRNLTVSGFDGCNNLRGSIQHVDTGSIEFGPIAATRKACFDMTVPDSFQQNMNQVRGYSRDGLKLYLLDGEGNELLSFQKTD